MKPDCRTIPKTIPQRPRYIQSWIYLYDMLLELLNTEADQLKQLLDWARKNDIQLSPLDQDDKNMSLPGRPLSNFELEELIKTGRMSGQIELNEAHELIRRKYAD